MAAADAGLRRHAELLSSVCDDAQALLRKLEVLRESAGLGQPAAWLEGAPSLQLDRRRCEADSDGGHDVEAALQVVPRRWQPAPQHGALPTVRWSRRPSSSGGSLSDLSLGSSVRVSLRNLRDCLPFAAGGGTQEGQGSDLNSAEVSDVASDSTPATTRRANSSTIFGGTRDKAEAGAGPPLDPRWREIFLGNDHGQEDDLLGRRIMTKKVSSNVNLEQVKVGAGRQSTCSGPVLSPNSKRRLVWDVFGMALMAYDLVTAPMYVGWGIITLSQGSGEYVMFVISVCYWCCDIWWSFNTGFVSSRGSLELSRRAVARRYLRTWFFFDIIVITLDLIRLLYSPYSAVPFLRGLRLLRVLRLIRLMRTSRLFASLEELFLKWGLQWVVMLASFVRAACWVFLMAHFCACFWFYLGVWGQRRGLPTWLDLMIEQGGDIESIWFQYIRSMYWVFGNLTNTSADSLMSARNEHERLFTLILVFSSVFVISTVVSNVTNLFAEISRMEVEKTSARRQLQQYLTAAEMPPDLSERVVRFALYSYERREAVSLDPAVAGLLSERLRSEISRIQRSRYLLLHPLFSLVDETHDLVFSHVCDVLVPRVYADSDIVFNAGTLATMFYLTHDGTFKLTTASHYPLDEPSEMIFQEPSWFCEVGLFCKYVHRSTLQSLTFGDAFTLATTDFMECVKVTPKCVQSVYRYAEEFAERLVDGFTDEKHHRVADFLPVEVSLDAARAVRAARHSNTEMDVFHAVDIVEGDPEPFLKMLAEKDLEPEDIVHLLPHVFTELNPDSGVYVKLKQQDERSRVMASMLNAVWLLKDRYDCFTECQAPQTKLSPEAWQEWQGFVRWADLSPDMVHAMLVFIAIRGLGKIAKFAKLLPRSRRSPEDVVLFLMEEMTAAVPSAALLDANMKSLVCTTLRTLSTFNLPQLLQGENIPYHINTFRQEIGLAGEQLHKFYLFSLVAVMCGLGGVQPKLGSSFLSETNSAHLLLVLRYMRQVMDIPPSLVYWGYITARARQLGLPTESQEQLVIARLCCLCRANAHDSKMLVTVWHNLSRGDRLILRRHFLADGLEDTTFVFPFLPQFFANAQANKAVGLERAFLVLIDLLEALWEEDHAAQTGTRVVVVDLKDLAAYTKDVCSPRTFLATITQSTLVASAGEVHVVISNKHKQRLKQTGWVDDPEMEQSTQLRRIMRKVYVMDAVLEEMITSSSDWTEDVQSL